MALHGLNTWSTRKILLVGLGLFVALVILTVELAVVAPYVLGNWHAFDYANYVEMGRALRLGQNPYGEHRYYPLPTALWIFLPLSLLPDWFRLVWVLVPVILIVIIHRIDGLLFLLFPPLWFAIGDGMLDGWLLLPLYWLLSNRPLLAGVGGALLLLKPQLALLLVIYRVGEWLVRRDASDLRAFFLTLAVLFVPSFLVDSNWIAQMLAVLPGRVSQSVDLGSQLTVSVWSWWYGGDWGRVGFVVLLMGVAVWMWQRWQQPSARAAMIEIVNLLVMVVILASSLIMLIPTVRGRKAIAVLIGVSWLAYLLSQITGSAASWTLVPLTALSFQTLFGEEHRHSALVPSLVRLKSWAKTFTANGMNPFHENR